MGTHQLSPHYCILQNVKARFYDSLNHLLGRVGARDLIILMGDFNAKIGGRNEGHEEVMGKHGVGKRNGNGKMFVETCVNNNLVIGGRSSEGPWKMSEPEEEQMQHLTTICWKGNLN
ncbi:hypothetical protein NHX12_022934 [Muraenolepis orangiensis]|uniref:Endonuclease/exonuclease/phosphatase domain-containing protein n=1 Tax=Muraenolepis orangiensis TaxID=630683 RepID=A0A9Q0EPB5_9TELE|nr:hypothetical protein NHX12_022934 [Muraenolepis orangiensis]